MKLSKIKNNIIEGDLKDACLTLLRELESANQPIKHINESRLLVSRIADLEESIRLGLISTNDANLQRNQIRSSLFSFMSILEEKTSTLNKGRAFISYRRDHGSETARAIRLALEKLGFNVFLDVEDIGSGSFGNALLDHINKTDVLILILSVGALESNNKESDWVQKEIEHAFKINKKIIPVMMPGFKMPELLPKNIAPVKQQNSIQYSHVYFDATIKRLIELIDN